MKGEVWRDILGYEGLYKVSNKARVKSMPVGRRSGSIIKQATNWRGYKTVSIYKDGKSKTKMVHRLLAIAFKKNPNNFPEVNHKNGIKDDNRIRNIEWCTGKYNTRHRFDVLNHAAHKRILTDEQCLIIHNTKKYYGFRKDLADRFGVTPATISVYLKYRSPKERSLQQRTKRDSKQLLESIK